MIFLISGSGGHLSFCMCRLSPPQSISLGLEDCDMGARREKAAGSSMQTLRPDSYLCLGRGTTMSPQEDEAGGKQPQQHTYNHIQQQARSRRKNCTAYPVPLARPSQHRRSHHMSDERLRSAKARDPSEHVLQVSYTQIKKK